MTEIELAEIPSPVLLAGDATTAYRDPAAIYHDGWFRLFFTLVRTEPDGRVFSYCAWSKSRDLGSGRSIRQTEVPLAKR